MYINIQESFVKSLASTLYPHFVDLSGFSSENTRHNLILIWKKYLNRMGNG